MKEVDLSDLTDWINEEKSNVDRAILRNKPLGRKIRTRPRDPDEIKILDQLCMKRWEKAEQEGKIRYLSDRVWYYEID
ncbi:hypothetical protein QNH23_13870 [Siminovitchia fortis]|uniref:Uncharacterized protein n=1 Tax=Siminovitchia fortis TaxID=254758 RepID=A0A443IVU1_9BACI|nr:hypothetical protein [Siminovitchia fortis]RWR12182.1 hypothetical protein D4N35_007375 [Siminovitchia fortis]WHY80981.1 hypothetical protein QNH23_13870 [Siminovitchia fortis]